MQTLFYEEYSPILVMAIVAIVLSVIILGASFLLAVQKPDTEKLSAYECGFDLEAMFLFPWVVSITHISSMGLWVMIDFLVELCIGFVYAWKIGALEWE